jgi:hypothetical protein
MEALFVAIVGIVGAAIGAGLSSWLGAREKVAEELRELRLKSYPQVWRRTSVVSRWPRTKASLGNVTTLHRHLRAWYFETGGLYLSDNSRQRYGELQELLEAVLVGVQSEGPLAVSEYERVMESASAFRTSLTEDLQSRQRRSLLSAIRLDRLHRKQAKEAESRLSGGPTGRYAARHLDVPVDDERDVDRDA